MAEISRTQTLDDVMARIRATTERSMPAESPLTASLQPWFNRLFTEYEIIANVVDQANIDVAQTLGNPIWSAEEQRRRATSVLAEHRASATKALDEMRATVATIRRTLDTAASPVRPQPADAAQEAALWRREGQLKMLLDALHHGDDVVSRLQAELDTALAAKDALAIWHLGSVGGWASLYCETRGGPVLAAKWELAAGNLLDDQLDVPARQARALRAAFASTPYSPEGSLAVADHRIGAGLNDLARRVAA